MFTILSDYGYFLGVPDVGYTTFARALRWSLIRAEKTAKHYNGTVVPARDGHGYSVVSSSLPTVTFTVQQAA